MNAEELELLNEIKKQIKEKESIVEKIKLENSDIEKIQQNNTNFDSINKNLHVERGRLIATYKSRLKEINSLYDKYDMFINIYHILNKEEGNNYTRSDKINELKNSMFKSEYNEFEEKILNIINNNLEDVDKMKSELYELDENNGIRDLIELKQDYSNVLKEHRENINTRYKNEFIHKKATIPTIFTVLPKAVALSVKKVVNCIRERKEAKTNKAKFNKFIKTLGAMGQVVATPVIYAGKFVVDHWYLLLLALTLLPDKFSLFPFLKKKKDKDKDDDKEKGDGEPQEQEEFGYNSAEEPTLISIGEKENEQIPVPEMDPVIDNPVVAVDGVPKSAIDYASDPRFSRKVETPEVETVSKPAIDYASDPRFSRKAETPEMETVSKPAIDYASDPRFSRKVETPEVETVPKPAIDYASDPRFSKKIDTPVVEEPKIIELNDEEKAIADEINERFVSNLEQDYGYVVSSRHQDMTVVHSAEEYVEALHNINPLIDVNEENAQFFYQKQMDDALTKPYERNIIWPEADDRVRFFENEQELADYVVSGEDPNLNDYYNRFVQNDGNMGLISQLSHLSESPSYQEFMKKIGISGTGATILFCLYEVAQYGLAIPTDGLSLALPF